MMSVPHPQKPLLGSAPVACSACRRLKMRCVGAENPPCARCGRTGRRCIVQPSRRGQQQAVNSLHKRQLPAPSSSSETLDNQDTRASISDATASATKAQPLSHPMPQHAMASRSLFSRIDTRSSPGSISHTGHSASPSLHSVYTSSPMDVLGFVATQKATAEPWTTPQLGSVGMSPQSSRLVDIAESVLVEYIEFFRRKILYCVPVLDDADLVDPLFVIRHKRPLAYCASFVASKFIPGSTGVRQRLLLHISDFIKTTNGPLTEIDDVLWTQLQALAVLYAYRPAADVFQLPGAPVSPGFLNHWVLKYSIEAFALRAHLHRSIDALRVLMQSDAPDVSRSPAFHKYVYWLWLVTMSHHFSLMTRTPPTIREDSTISSAVDLLRDVPRPPRVTRILAEIDLYMLWQQAGRSAPGLAEWWCTPSDSMGVEEVVAVLDDMEGALEVWSHRWGLRGEPKTTMSNVDISKNTAVDFHFHGTRFCISTFGTRYILEKTQSTLDQDIAFRPGLTQIVRESVLKSVKAAHASSRCLVDMPPLRRESVRYMAEFGYALMAFCCVYIIQAYELFGTALPILESFLASVEEVATFMTEMAVANNTAPRLYGMSVMRQLRRAIHRDDGAPIDSQTWSRQYEASGEDERTISSAMYATVSIPDDDLLTPLEDPLATNGRMLSHSAPSPVTSPPLFSIFDPSWGPLLR